MAEDESLTDPEEDSELDTDEDGPRDSPSPGAGRAASKTIVEHHDADLSDDETHRRQSSLFDRGGSVGELARMASKYGSGRSSSMDFEHTRGLSNGSFSGMVDGSGNKMSVEDEMELHREMKMKLKEAFKIMFPNDDPDFDEDELREAIKKINVELSEEEFSALVNLLGEDDGDGFYAKDDLEAILNTPLSDMSVVGIQEKIMRAVIKLDTGDGSHAKSSSLLKLGEDRYWSKGQIAIAEQEMLEAIAKMAAPMEEEMLEEEKFEQQVMQHFDEKPEDFEPSNAMKWGIEEVVYWLSSISMQEYAKKMKIEGITGEVLLTDINEYSLQQLGVRPVHVKAMMRRIHELRRAVRKNTDLELHIQLTHDIHFTDIQSQNELARLREALDLSQVTVEDLREQLQDSQDEVMRLTEMLTALQESTGLELELPTSAVASPRAGPVMMSHSRSLSHNRGSSLLDVPLGGSAGSLLSDTASLTMTRTMSHERKLSSGMVPAMSAPMTAGAINTSNLLANGKLIARLKAMKESHDDQLADQLASPRLDSAAGMDTVMMSPSLDYSEDHKDDQPSSDATPAPEEAPTTDDTTSGGATAADATETAAASDVAGDGDAAETTVEDASAAGATTEDDATPVTPAPPEVAKPATAVLKKKESEIDMAARMAQLVPSQTFGEPANAENWSKDEVAFWIYSIGFGQYTQAFHSVITDGEMLMFDVTNQSLREDLGVRSIHCRRILKEVEKLRRLRKGCWDTELLISQAIAIASSDDPRIADLKREIARLEQELIDIQEAAAAAATAGDENATATTEDGSVPVQFDEDGNPIPTSESTPADDENKDSSADASGGAGGPTIATAEMDKIVSEKNSIIDKLQQLLNENGVDFEDAMAEAVATVSEIKPAADEMDDEMEDGGAKKEINVAEIVARVKAAADSDPSYCASENVMDWSHDEVCYWLVKLQYENYIKAFVEMGIDGSILVADVTESWLKKDLGVKKMHRKRIMREIEGLRRFVDGDLGLAELEAEAEEKKAPTEDDKISELTKELEFERSQNKALEMELTTLKKEVEVNDPALLQATIKSLEDCAEHESRVKMKTIQALSKEIESLRLAARAMHLQIQMYEELNRGAADQIASALGYSRQR